MFAFKKKKKNRLKILVASALGIYDFAHVLASGRCSENSHLTPTALGERLSTFTRRLIPVTLLLSKVHDLKMSRHSSAGSQATEVCE